MEVVVHEVEHLGEVSDIAVGMEHHNVHSLFVHPMALRQRLPPDLRKVPRLRRKVYVSQDALSGMRFLLR